MFICLIKMAQIDKHSLFIINNKSITTNKGKI
jgi:hypothetical protein